MVIVAEITTNLAAAADPASLYIDVASPEGKATGLDQDSVTCCLFLAKVAESRIGSPVGKFSVSMMQKLNDCLKAAMAIH
jgi:mRNA interferase MazF